MASEEPSTIVVERSAYQKYKALLDQAHLAYMLGTSVATWQGKAIPGPSSIMGTTCSVLGMSSSTGVTPPESLFCEADIWVTYTSVCKTMLFQAMALGKSIISTNGGLVLIRQFWKKLQ